MCAGGSYGTQSLLHKARLTHARHNAIVPLIYLLNGEYVCPQSYWSPNKNSKLWRKHFFCVSEDQHLSLPSYAVHLEPTVYDVILSPACSDMLNISYVYVYLG